MPTTFRAALLIALAPLAAAAALPTVAQAAAPAVTVGATVTDTAGGLVGTVSALKDGLATVKTDQHEVQIPVTSFGAGANGTVILSVTRAELNAQVAQSLAAASANVKVGAAVTGAAGAPVGTISAIEGDLVTLKLASGKLVKLPRAGVAGTETGAAIGMTLAELNAAVAASEAAAPK